MDTKGKHVIVDYWGCDPDVLTNKDTIQRLMMEAALETGATIVETVFHRFTPTGVSGVVVVAESHLSIHTWPDQGYASTDFYTCGECDPVKAHEFLRRAFRASTFNLVEMSRGESPKKLLQITCQRHWEQQTPPGTVLQPEGEKSWESPSAL